MVDWLLLNISYFGIVLALILTGCGMPIPEEVPIVAAGMASAGGSLHPWGAFVACLIGAILGDCVLYSIGYHFGHGLAKKHPRFAQLLHADREAQIEDMMRRHGFKLFFIARFMVGFRAPVYLTAGILRISFRRFLFIDGLCATAVVSTFYWLSYHYGDTILKWILQLDIAVTITVLIVLAGAGILFWRRRRRNLLVVQSAVVAEALSLTAAGNRSSDDTRPNNPAGRMPRGSDIDLNP